MDALKKTTSASIDIPRRKSTSPSERMRHASEFEYNAGLDQFVPNSPPEELKRAYRAVDKFFAGLADWMDPEGATRRR